MDGYEWYVVSGKRMDLFHCFTSGRVSPKDVVKGYEQG